MISIVLSFQWRLHSIKEDSTLGKTWFGFSAPKTIFSVIISVFLSINMFFGTEIIFLKYFKINLVIALLYIVIPKYGIILPNPNLAFYLSVYHHQPPPVLPWQLPLNFKLNSVKLIVVS